MARPILYELLIGPLRFALSVYFRRVEVRGREHLPTSGPVVLAANHPQSITDALVLAASCDRVVHYLAHSGLFKARLQSAILRRCGVIPITRPSDDPEQAASGNASAFAACTEALARGEVIGIFPEGISVGERRVQPMKTGAARIVLESGLDCCVVPVGLSFQSSARFRSRVLVRFGPPIPASAWVHPYMVDPVGAVRGLTEQVGRAISQLIVNVERSQLDDLVADIERTYRDDLLQHPGLILRGESRFQRETELSTEIARAVSYFHEVDPEALWSLRTHLRHYRRSLDEWRVTDPAMLEREAPTLRTVTLPWMLVILGLPLALLGAFVNATPYLFTYLGVRRIDPDATKRHYHQLVYGSVSCLVYYPLLLFLLQRRWNLDTLGVVLVFLPMIPLGIFARAYVHRILKERGRVRFALFGSSHRAAVNRLRMMRKHVVREMDTLLERYLQARNAGEVSR